LVELRGGIDQLGLNVVLIHKICRYKTDPGPCL
jgi:hypothetical protein